VRQANACISSSTFDDRTAWPQLTFFFSIFDYIKRRTVFYAASRILKFGFA